MNPFEIFFDQLITKGAYKDVLKGLLKTVEIAVGGLIIGILLGTVIAVVRVMPKYNTLPKILDKICNVYVALFRGTPMVVQLLLGYWVLLPALHISANSLAVAIVMFGLNSAAYVSEMMRSGIQSVDIGQLEAARALGLPYKTSMLKIVIPQSIKNILPTLGNEFIVLVKDTTVASFIAVHDLTYELKHIADATYEYLVPYIALAIIYLIMVIGITFGIRAIERRLRRSEKQ